jgi:hypothetical protein
MTDLIILNGKKRRNFPPNVENYQVCSKNIYFEHLCAFQDPLSVKNRPKPTFSALVVDYSPVVDYRERLVD